VEDEQRILGDGRTALSFSLSLVTREFTVALATLTLFGKGSTMNALPARADMWGARRLVNPKRGTDDNMQCNAMQCNAILFIRVLFRRGTYAIS
jgi:hypothetical protein